LLDSSLRTPTIFQKETQLNLLSALGKIDLEKKTLGDYFDFRSRNDQARDSIPFIENLRKLRYSIEKSGKKAILFTSNRAKEGKTTVVEALAHTFSMSRKKILLIDANFSNNALTRDYSAKPALETFSMTGQQGIDKIWDVTTPTRISQVDIIGCNEGNYTPSEILPAGHLLNNLDKLTKLYDYILIEGSALNHHADSKELSEYVDGIVLVCSAQNSLGEADRESLGFIREHKDKLIGAVLNNVDGQNLEF